MQTKLAAQYPSPRHNQRPGASALTVDARLSSHRTGTRKTVLVAPDVTLSV